MNTRLPVLVSVIGMAFVVSTPAATAVANDRYGESIHIPAFARMYRTTCSTCHTAAPKLNVMGEVFRLNGYRMPESSLLRRRDDPLPLGNDAWKDEWPRSIWPGKIPGQVPLALRIQSDAQVTTDSDGDGIVRYDMPHEVYLLAGGSIGGSISTFLEMEWSPDHGLEVVQAKVLFQDLIGEGGLNLWLGQLNPYLFTFADRQIDRAARQKFAWQEFSPSKLVLGNPSTGAELTSESDFELGGTYPSVELNGLLTRRLSYGLGLAQGVPSVSDDSGGGKDLYYRLRYKFGGLDLRGTYDPGGGPVLSKGGQLLDRSLIVEHFAYFASDPVGPRGAQSSFGVNVRGLLGHTDIGVGYVWSRYDDPWDSQAAGDLEVSSTFGKLEYLFFPWLIGSLKADKLRSTIPDGVRALGYSTGAEDRSRIMPGAVFLLRQNVRGVIEGEFFVGARSGNLANSLWLRLDLAF